MKCTSLRPSTPHLNAGTQHAAPVSTKTRENGGQATQRQTTCRINPHRRWFRVIGSAGRALRPACLATARPRRRSAQNRRRARSGSLACRKAAARGRGALTPLRMPPGGVRLPRALCLGASRTGQRRRPATHSEGGGQHWPRRASGDGHSARRWPAVVTPGRAVQRAGDAAASHSAADGAGPSIEGARTYAHASSRPRPIQLLQNPAFLWAIHIARAQALDLMYDIHVCAVLDPPALSPDGGH